MNYYVSLSGQLHRERYFPDSVVKCHLKLAVHDRSTAVRSPQGMVPYDPSRLDDFAMCGGSFHTGSSHVAQTDGAVVEVQSLSVRLIGICFTDTLKVASDQPWGSKIPLETLSEEGILPSPDSTESGRAENAHLIFATPPVEPMSSTRLKYLEQRCFAASFKLPPGLPPTFRGCSVRFYYGVHVSCVWSTGGKLQYTTLKAPVRLSSPISALAVVRPPFAAPSFDFCSQCMVVPVGQSSPAFAAPLSDALLVKDESWKRTMRPGSSEPTCCGTSSYLLEALHQLQEKESQPVDYQVRYNVTPVMNAVFFSTAVALGDSIRGVFLQSPNNDVVISRITASVESVERVPPKFLCRGNTSASGEDVVVNVAVVDEQEWFTLNSAQIPFEFFLSPSKYTQTLQTHIVSLSWRVVLKFWSVPKSEHASAKRLKKLADLYQELDVPVRIFSPGEIHNPRMGLLVVSPSPSISS
jgi:hypothetical protein